MNGGHDDSVLPIYVLAGGQSHRFGSDKAREILDGVPIILGLKRSLESGGKRVFFVADRGDRYADFEIESIVDLRTASVPLAGVETALRHRLGVIGEGWILVTNCDTVRWSEAWTRSLQEAASQQCDAIVFADERLQPLPGMYHTRILPLIEAEFERRQFSLHELLSACTDRARVIPISHDCPRDWSFNTREQLSEVIAKRKGKGRKGHKGHKGRKGQMRWNSRGADGRARDLIE